MKSYFHAFVLPPKNFAYACAPDCFSAANGELHAKAAKTQADIKNFSVESQSPLSWFIGTICSLKSGKIGKILLIGRD
jgi:hypothetical protein